MRERISGPWAIRLIAALLLAGVLGCPAVQPTPGTDDTTDPGQAYLAAIQDAKVAEPSEISKDLWAITAANPELMWDGEPGNSRVLVVTWTSYTGYNAQVGQDIQTTRDIWVTAVPQVQEFVRNHRVGADDLTLRLEELLGVPPESGKTTFVEFWVRPADLVRPSPDPEVSDQEAELAFPTSPVLSVSDAYVQWFNSLLGTSYGDGGYPWTRLGYTYDWGDSTNHVGASEYVIWQGATVGVQGTWTTEDYCRWW